MRKNKIIRPINSNSTITPNIIRGGKAIDLGNNMYYIAGRKHTNGGVDVGKDLEVEGGEVMQMKPNEVRVFSSVPFLRAGSPAKLVLGGANPNAVFNAQENFKNRNRIKDDGTKYRNGGNKLNNIQYIIDKINNSDKDFAKRLKQNNRQYIKDWEIPGAIATHKLSVGTDKDGNNYIYPEVQNINGGLHDFTNPKYKHNKWDGQISAEERGDTIRINTIQDGLDFTRNYKNLNIYPKFNYGGNMITTINGNVKNGLIHTMKCGGRKKAKVGTGFRINNDKYKIGDTFDYKRQKYYVDARNEAVPVSADLSKANPYGITNAIKTVDWLKAQEKYIPDTNIISNKSTSKPANNASDTNTISMPQLNYPKTKTNNNKNNNTRNVQYTPNPNLVDIPQSNVGNIGTYFYNPKTTSTTTKRTVGSNAQPANNLVKSIVDNTSLTVPYTQPDKISIPRYTEDVYKKPSLASMAKEIENVDTINLARQYTKPNKFNRFTDWFNNNLDKINLYSNLGGSAIDFISSAIINSKMPTVDLPTMTAPTLANLPEIKLAEIKDLEAPVTVAAAKLKTRYNANPQLAKIEDETRRTMNEIDRNTSSSRVALARKQRAAIQSQESKNQVYGQKENIETELMNKDRLNAQQVAQANAATYNQFLTTRAQQAMQKAQLKMMVDRANIGNKLAVDQFNANSKLAVDQFNTNNLIKELLFNNNVRTTQLGNYAAGIGNLFSNIGGSLNNYMINRNARLRDEEVLRSLRARYKEIPQEIMDYILNK